MLSQEDILRYSRHLPVIGLSGQQQLQQAKVLCVGAGGLAAGALPPLVAAGIGCIGIVDGDLVELSNLQRQVIFRESQIGLNKALAAKACLQDLNAQCKLEEHTVFLDESNAEAIIANYDIVIDATDNFEARYLLNKATRQSQTPLVMASIFQFDAQISVFNYQNGPCYECLYPAPPPAGFVPNCALGGVLGVLPNVVGGLQATQVIKVILGLGDSLSGKLLTMDLSSLQFKTFPIRKSAMCSPNGCSNYQESVQSDQQRERVMIQEISSKELAPLVGQDDYYILDVREDFEREICKIDSMHIPLSQLPQRVSEVPQDKTIIAYCKGGVRSQQAAAILMDAGCQQVLSLAGGILAWRDEIDPSMMEY